MKARIKLMIMLLVMVGMTTLTSCNKDPQIYGKWNCTKMVVTDGENEMEVPSNGIHTLEFFKNGDVVADDDNENSGTFTLNGNDITLKDIFKVNINGEIQKIDISGTVKTLSKTDLVMDFILDPEMFFGMDEGGHMIMEFKR